MSLKLMFATIALAMLLTTIGCSSPETPPAGTTPSANPAGAGSSAAPARSRTIEGYREVPQLSTDHATNLEDVERDLENVTSRRPEGPKELADDLTALVEEPGPSTRQPIDALVRELGAVLPDAKNGDALRRRLAELLFVATRKGVLSLERVGELEAEAQKLLVEHGVAEARAKTVAGHIGTLARGGR